MMASMLPFHLAILATVAPLIFAATFMIMVCIIPSRYGIDIWLYQRAVFGHKLVFVIFIIAVATTWGWYAITSQVLGGSVSALLNQAGGNFGEEWNAVFALICPVVGFVIGVNGPNAIKYAVYITVPCVVFVGVLLLIKTASTTTLSELMAIKPTDAEAYGSVRNNLLMGFEFSFAFAFSWYPVLGGFSRLTKSEKSSYWGQLGGIYLPVALLISVGILTATMMASRGIVSSYPSEWLDNFGGFWANIAQVANILGNFTLQTVGIYSLSLATKTFKPTWNFKVIALIYTVYCMILIVWKGVWDYYNIFLAAVAIVAAPALALILSDFFMVRKRNFSIKWAFRRGGEDTYNYSGGFNLVGLFSFLLAIVCYLVVYNPINYVINNEALLLLTPSGLSFIVAFFSYYLLSKIPKVQEYLLQDKKYQSH